MKKAIKRGSDMTLQLSFDFYQDYPTTDGPEDDETLKEAERIIQKYLMVSHHVSLYYDYCTSHSTRSLDKYMRRYYKALRMVKKAGNRMMQSLPLDFVYFNDEEKRYFESKPGSEKQRIRGILDGFGYIQEVFDHDNRTEERYYIKDGDEYDPDNAGFYENGSPMGYHCFLFEDPISHIPIPVQILNRYMNTYACATRDGY